MNINIPFQARVAYPSIVLNGFDYFSKLEPYFLTLAHIDSCDGQRADDLHLQLADRDNRFISDWMPGKGVFLDVGIIAERWFSPNASRLNLDCGRLWIDEIEFELPQHTCTIKATSIPTSSYLKASDHTRGWENQSLRAIAQQICDENKVQLSYPSTVYNPTYAHVEQTEQSSLEFIMHRARDAKLSIRLFRNQLIVFDEEVIEAEPPKFAIVYGNALPSLGLPIYRMAGGKFTTRLVDTIKQLTVSHLDPASGKSQYSTVIAGDSTAEDDWHTNVSEGSDSTDEGESGGGGGGGGGGGRSVTPRDDVQPVADYNDPGGASQVRLAKSRMRGKNKDQVHGEIDLALGNPLIASGMTFTLSGLGNYDGKWFAESIEHKCGPMFTSRIQARRCLTGY